MERFQPVKAGILPDPGRPHAADPVGRCRRRCDNGFRIAGRIHLPMMDCLPRSLRIRGALLALLLAFHAVGSFAAGIPMPGMPAADATAAAAPKSTAPEPIAAG